MPIPFRDAGIGLLVGLALGTGGGFAAGWSTARRPAIETRTVSSQAILTTLRARGFLVSQTIVFDLPATISRSSGSAFKDFFVGQTITARASMEANLGIDLSGLSAEDLHVEGSAISVRIPRATVFNIRPLGPLDVKNERGILKRLFDADDGYNEALAELSRVAEEAAKRPEILERADAASREELQRLLTLAAPGMTTSISFR
jgi:hypothetical protein